MFATRYRLCAVSLLMRRCRGRDNHGPDHRTPGRHRAGAVSGYSSARPWRTVAALSVPSAVTYFIGRQSPPGKVIRLAVIIALIMTFLVGLALFPVLCENCRATRYHPYFLAADLGGVLAECLYRHTTWAHSGVVRRYGALDLERMLGSGLRVGAIVLLWIIGVKSVIAFAAIYMIAGLAHQRCLRLPGNANAANTFSETPRRRRKSGLTRAMRAVRLPDVAATVSARLDQAIMPAIVATNDLDTILLRHHCRGAGNYYD